jgi:DNA-binding NarL/FixJ family response regulator
MEKITILLADDHRLILESWKYLLENDSRFAVIALADNGMKAVELATTLKPKVVLLDINMKELDGFEATKLIRKCAPGTKVIGVSMHTMPAYAKKMIKFGASGYVTKNSPRAELIQAILDVCEGKIYVCEEIKCIIVNMEVVDTGTGPDMNVLSKRELEVISFITKGLSSKQISSEMNVALKTVEVHRYNILKKLSLPNTASLVSYANHFGI